MQKEKKSGQHSPWWYLASVVPIALVLVAGLGGGYFLRRPDILIYRNLSSITAHEHDKLKCGDKIGEVRPDNVAAGKVQLRVELEQETEVCPPLDTMPTALASHEVAEGRTVYAAICAGCHTIRQIGTVIKNGKLITGEPAVATTVMEKIRKGGGRMPAFVPSVLPPPELCAVTSFLLAKSR
jgi:hypothetical protein